MSERSNKVFVVQKSNIRDIDGLFAFENFDANVTVLEYVGNHHSSSSCTDPECLEYDLKTHIKATGLAQYIQDIQFPVDGKIRNANLRFKFHYHTFNKSIVKTLPFKKSFLSFESKNICWK